ncbi:DUF4406 domain-containing protein [Olsenella phocaeensis]|uniref:DUF4406 domain-containing protein n=1 Tax=Olsenella phocaeensis TaxID=1852385 RepID=UPI000931BFE8|nr:DUF4406 domain-containing protein [Olsenella phocaeensis]
MNVYLSGPVTGRDYEDACADFARAAARLRMAGHEVWVPTERVTYGTDHGHGMRKCIDALVNDCFPGVDTLVQLPGWEGSEGASLERDVAMACGIRVMELEEALGERNG